MVPYVLAILSLATLATAESGAVQWSEFTNNFATDIAPIIVLFGEQVTKQFLSESTGLLDNIIFGLAPLGVLTAVVSAIRVYGSASLKSFVGRAQEAHGVAEAELCSSTSEDVCELWSNGGICRVFGRPKILEFFFTQKGEFYPEFGGTSEDKSSQSPTCRIELPKQLFTVVESPTEGDKTSSNWEETHSRGWPGSKRHYHSRKDSEPGKIPKKFAPYPNLSLNIGIRTVRYWVFYIAVSFGTSLQLSFFVYATWATFYAPSLYEGEDSPQVWSFGLVVSGTILLVVGMSLCAWLIERKSCERSFKQRARNDSTTKESAVPTKQNPGKPTSKKEDCIDLSGPQTAICWLQPGDQRIGDQLFNAFAYAEKKQEYMTSWKVGSGPSENDPESIKYPLPKLWIAITFSLLGFICQFVGLRGLHGSIALYQLASTLIMAVIRALLRSRRLQGDKNQLGKWHRTVDGHELDWQALQLESSLEEVQEEVQRASESDQMRSTNSSEANQELRWYIHDHPSIIKDLDDDKHSSAKADDVTVLRLNNGSRQQIVGFLPSSGGSSESKLNAVETRCADSAVYWIRHNEMNKGHPEKGQPNKAARIMHFRSRLAFLTSYPITPHKQAWDTDIRRMAEQLQEALQGSANYIFAGVMRLSKGWKDASALVWSTTCQLSDPSTKSPIFPIYFLMYRKNRRWTISKYQLEAALGLWLWSLKLLPGERQLFTRKVMLVEKSQEREFKSAIRLWVTQADTINDRIEILSPKPTGPSGSYCIPAGPSEELYHPTSLSISTTTLLGPLESKEDESEDMPRNRVLAVQTRSSSLQMIAQDIFTTFISRIADIMEPLEDAVPRQSESAAINTLNNSQDRPYLGLMNTDVESITDVVVAAGIGPRQDVLMSIIPPLLERSKLPHLDKVMEDLLFHARSLRRNSRFQVGEDLLNGLLHLAPAQFHEKVVRALGELYRAAIRSTNQQEHDFGTHGFEKMRKTCAVTGLSDAAKVTVDHYQFFWEDFKELNNENTRKLRSLDSEKKFLDDLKRQNARPRGLTVINEIKIRPASPKGLLEILKWAIEKNSPELVEDLWSVDKSLIHKSDDLRGQTPIFWAVETGCDVDTFQSLLEWPTIRPDSYDKYGTTPFLLAAQKGHYKALELLLKQGADTMAKDREDKTALSLASEFGHHQVVERILRERVEVNAQVPVYGSALAAAVCKTQAKIVKVLVLKGKADVNMQLQGGDYGSALAAAAANAWENTETAKFLIQEGADVNMQLRSGRYGSALAAAAAAATTKTRSRENTEIIRLLIQEGADVNMQLQDGSYGSALTAAVYWGNTEIIKLLVQEGADVNMQLQSGSYGSALAAAAYMEKTEIVEFLIQKGADVNMKLQRGQYGSALAAATNWRNIKIVNFLVQEGADVSMELQSGDYGSALASAACRGNTKMIEFLIQEGADVNMELQGGKYGSALAAAASERNASNVEFLVQEGADINMQLQNGTYGSALTAAITAIARKDAEIVKFLIQKGADVNMKLQNGNYGSALAAAAAVEANAAYNGNTEIIKLLLQKGADVNMPLQSGDYGSALSAAAVNSWRNTQIAEFLIRKGADVNMELQRGNHGSALAAAAYEGYTELVEFLVQEGADVNMQLQSGNYGSALAAAAAAKGNSLYFHFTRIIKFLIQKEADVNMQLQSGNYGSALAAAAAGKGKAEIIELLIQNGADINMHLQRGIYGSALAAAAYGGRTEIVKLLIQEGADVNMQLQSGDYGSALAAAAYGGYTEIVEFLVQEGKADVNQSLSYKRFGNALLTAAYFGWKQCVEILVKSGMEVTLRSERGPFHSALHAAMVEISGEDLKQLSWDKRSKQERRQEKEETAALLRHYGAID